jgi:hypothetical protein
VDQWSQHFDENQDPGPDLHSHQSEKSDPDPHQSEKLDPCRFIPSGHHFIPSIPQAMQDNESF